jgi:hypothetical protein
MDVMDDSMRIGTSLLDSPATLLAPPGPCKRLR